jgi:hypothetical protein
MSDAGDPNANGKEITVFGLEEPKELGLFFNRAEARYQRRAVPIEQLGEQFNAFVDNMRDVVARVPASMAGFRLDEISFTAEVSAKGTVNLLGTGGEIAGGGGITITLRRDAEGAKGADQGAAAAD